MKHVLAKKNTSWLALVAALALTASLSLFGCSSGDSAASDTAAPDAATEQQASTEQQSPAEQQSSAETADTINVTVAIDMPDNGMAESSVVETAIPTGGTAYDALVKSGATVQDEDGEYGKFVTSINGVENGSEGSASGWVYTVNDQQVTESCDACVLSEGDTVTWSFYVG